MRDILRHHALLLTLIGLFAPAAQAAPPLGVQDDDAMIGSGALAYLDRAQTLGASWIRLNVSDVRWNHERAGGYVEAARLAHERGLKVMVTLMAWKTRPTARKWEAYARQVAFYLAPYVDAWSPMNEPNIDPMAAAAPNERACYRDRPKFADWFCEQRHRARAYARVWNRVTPVLREFDPSAQIIAGELAPTQANATFMRVALRRMKLRPRILGVHPYDDLGGPTRGSFRLRTARATVRFARRHGRMSVWATEWAFTPEVGAARWVRAIRRMGHAGMQRVFLYDSRGATWDTKMRPGVRAAIGRARAKQPHNRLGDV